MIEEPIPRSKRSKRIEDVLEEVEVLIDTHFFNEFSETKSASFLKKEITHQNETKMNKTGKRGGR